MTWYFILLWNVRICRKGFEQYIKLETWNLTKIQGSAWLKCDSCDSLTDPIYRTLCFSIWIVYRTGWLLFFWQTLSRNENPCDSFVKKLKVCHNKIFVKLRSDASTHQWLTIYHVDRQYLDIIISSRSWSATIALLIICPSFHLKQNSVTGNTAKTTGPIYLFFFMTR